MYYYRITGDAENFANFLPQNYSMKMAEQFDGRSHADGWEGLHFTLTDPNDERPIPEIITGYIPIYSRRVYEKIKDICSGFVEFLPCTVGEEKKEFFVFNILGAQDSVDYEKSVFHRFKTGNGIKYFERIAFKEKVKAPMFRIPDLPYTYFFCTEKFKVLLEQIHVQGIQFSSELFKEE